MALEGARALKSLVARLPPAVASAWNSHAIVPSQWYPLSSYVALHRAADLVTGKGPTLAYAIGYESARADHGEAWRLVKGSRAPSGLGARASAAWSLLHDFGQVSLPETRPDGLRLDISGCAGFDSRVWADVTGSSIGFLETLGVSNPRARTLSGGGIADYLKLNISWDA